MNGRQPLRSAGCLAGYLLRRSCRGGPRPRRGTQTSRSVVSALCPAIAPELYPSARDPLRGQLLHAAPVRQRAPLRSMLVAGPAVERVVADGLASRCEGAEAELRNGGPKDRERRRP